MCDKKDEKVEILCKGCGKTFYAFLKQMADRNAKVVCPNCGKVFSKDEALKNAKPSGPTSTAQNGQQR